MERLGSRPWPGAGAADNDGGDWPGKEGEEDGEGDADPPLLPLPSLGAAAAAPAAVAAPAAAAPAAAAALLAAAGVEGGDGDGEPKPLKPEEFSTRCAPGGGGGRDEGRGAEPSRALAGALRRLAGAPRLLLDLLPLVLGPRSELSSSPTAALMSRHTVSRSSSLMPAKSASSSPPLGNLVAVAGDEGDLDGLEVAAGLVEERAGLALDGVAAARAVGAGEARSPCVAGDGWSSAAGRGPFSLASKTGCALSLFLLAADDSTRSSASSSGLFCGTGGEGAAGFALGLDNGLDGLSVGFAFFLTDSENRRCIWLVTGVEP